MMLVGRTDSAYPRVTPTGPVAVPPRTLRAVILAIRAFIFKVSGMDHADCAALVDKTLASLPGVVSSRISIQEVGRRRGTDSSAARR